MIIVNAKTGIDFSFIFIILIVFLEIVRYNSNGSLRKRFTYSILPRLFNYLLDATHIMIRYSSRSWDQ